MTPAKMDNDSRDWITPFFISLGVVALAILGGIAKLLHDFPDDGRPITTRDWLRYCTASLLAGAVVAIFFYESSSSPIRLIGLSGLAGFGAISILGAGVRVLTAIMGRGAAQPQSRTDDEKKDN